MNWPGGFSSPFSPRLASAAMREAAAAAAASSSDSSPEQKPLMSGGGLAAGGCAGSFSDSEVPLSRTHQYKKITKPLLERKRRARINKCLDELKDIMTVALQAEGENVSKLEKADILELTVRHLHKLSQSRRLMVRNPLEDLQRFQAGYSACAKDAASFLLSTPGVDVRLSQRLVSHLSTTAGPAMAANISAPLTLTVPVVGGQRRPSTTATSSSSSSTPPSSPQPSASSSSLTMPAADPTSQSSSPLTLTQGSFTLSIRRQTPEPLTERTQNEKSMPVRPAAIRLNPCKVEAGETVWRPYSSS